MRLFDSLSLSFLFRFFVFGNQINSFDHQILISSTDQKSKQKKNRICGHWKRQQTMSQSKWKWSYRMRFEFAFRTEDNRQKNTNKKTTRGNQTGHQWNSTRLSRKTGWNAFVIKMFQTKCRCRCDHPFHFVVAAAAVPSSRKWLKCLRWKCVADTHCSELLIRKFKKLPKQKMRALYTCKSVCISTPFLQKYPSSIESDKRFPRFENKSLSVWFPSKLRMKLFHCVSESAIHENTILRSLTAQLDNTATFSTKINSNF